MTRVRGRHIVILVAALVLSTCARDEANADRDASALKQSRTAENQITAIALERILKHVAVDDVRVDPKSVCVARTAEIARFEPVPAAVLETLQVTDARIVSASQCTTQVEEWGRVVRRSDLQPSILVAAKPYIFEHEDRAFVLGSWYVNTMRAQRFVFVFKRDGGQWKLDDGSKLGVV